MRRRNRASKLDDFELGAAAWQATPRDADAAVSHWERAADSGGDTRAMTALGLAYSVELQPRDVDKARYWFERAAGTGDVNACYQLGVLAVTSDPPDHKSAQEWWQLAADAGHVYSMGCLGDLYAEIAPQDPELSRRWWERAAEGGLADAMYRLGVLAMTEDPEGDLRVTMEWYEQAAQAGNAEAMFALGTMYEGVVEPRDLEAAKHWLRRARNAGHSGAQRSLDALTEVWTVPSGWGRCPPNEEQISAMAQWIDRHSDAVDELLEGVEPTMEGFMDALMSRNMNALRAACDQVGLHYTRRLAGWVPTPDPDLTEAVRLLTCAADKLRQLGTALPAHPTKRDVDPIQGGMGDIAAHLERAVDIYVRDCEIVESSAS
ncbi:MAG: tetratricopeptide repeat protein [Mycobacterium sp.]